MHKNDHLHTRLSPSSGKAEYLQNSKLTVYIDDAKKASATRL